MVTNGDPWGIPLMVVAVLCPTVWSLSVRPWSSKVTVRDKESERLQRPRGAGGGVGGSSAETVKQKEKKPTSGCYKRRPAWQCLLPAPNFNLHWPQKVRWNCSFLLPRVAHKKCAILEWFCPSCTKDQPKKHKTPHK